MGGIVKNSLVVLIESLMSCLELGEILPLAAERIAIALDAHSCVLVPCSGRKFQSLSAVEWSAAARQPSNDQDLLRIAAFIEQLKLPVDKVLAVSDSQDLELFGEVRESLEVLEVGSIVSASVYLDGESQVILFAYRDRSVEAFSGAEVALLQYIVMFLSLALRNCLEISELKQSHNRLSKFDTQSISESAVQGDDRLSFFVPSEVRYTRLIEQSDAIIFHIDNRLAITFLNPKAKEFFGLIDLEVSQTNPFMWSDLAHLDDRTRFEKDISEFGQNKASFDEEFKIVNRRNGEARCLLVRFVRVINEDGELLGWDGFGLDVTSRREEQEALAAQNKRLQALYTVSSAIGGCLDTAHIAARGLGALCDAAEAEAGFCCFVQGKEQNSVTLAAHQGFSVGFAHNAEVDSNLIGFCRYAALNKKPLLLPDITSDPRVSRIFSSDQGMRSAILVPLCVEEEGLGAIGLFHRRAAKFSNQDLMLVSAAASQIALAARQASLFAAYRKQAKNLAALYRMSHELSSSLTLEQVFEKAFEIIHDELDVRRIWVGLLNETGNRIVGRAAFGAGWKKRLVEITIQLVGTEHPIAKVVRTRTPMILENPEDILRSFGAKRFYQNFSLHALGLVPLIAGGQVLGVLAFEPGEAEPQLMCKELSLIATLAAELAFSVLAKGLEERVAQGEKMRTAGLLAAGIAHNFNNFLQTILGQASLLEMQFANEPKVKSSTKAINDAAAKGSKLVKQLISFANLEEPNIERCDVNNLIEQGLETITKSLRARQQIKLRLTRDLPSAKVDPRQLVKILITLVGNATEAIGEDGEVQISTEKVSINGRAPRFEVPEGEYIRIGVRDNGIGMDVETCRRCFEPFFTTKNVDPNSGLSLTGAGLGLAAAYALARKNCGQLAVESRKFYGSLFTLYLPVNVEERQRSQQFENKPEEKPSKE